MTPHSHEKRERTATKGRRGKGNEGQNGKPAYSQAIGDPTVPVVPVTPFFISPKAQIAILTFSSCSSNPPVKEVDADAEAPLPDVPGRGDMTPNYEYTSLNVLDSK